MTREEAIKNIKEHCYFASLIPQAKEALDMAIKALEQEPCDCISREYILSKAHCCCDDLADDECCCVDVDDIKEAPSVQPKTDDFGKIRAEIEAISIVGQVDEHTRFIRTGEHVKQMALDIIDKYKAESEEE